MLLEISEGKYGVRVNVIREDGRYMGGCFVSIPNRTLYNVVTDHEFRRQGVGKFMMQGVMNLPQYPTNLTCVPFGDGCLSVEQTMSFYEKFGFVPVGKPRTYGVPMQYVDCDNLSSLLS